MEEIARRHVEQSAAWLAYLACLFSYISPRFGRIERQRHAWEYLLGLLSVVERKNGWQRVRLDLNVFPTVIGKFSEGKIGNCLYEIHLNQVVPYAAGMVGTGISR